MEPNSSCDIVEYICRTEVVGSSEAEEAIGFIIVGVNRLFSSRSLALVATDPEGTTD